jgi:DNA invertase Pin-like site-specific DNA recombinase
LIVHCHIVPIKMSRKLTPMKIGYARTSTRKQEAGLAAQLRTLLEQNGCEEIFQEQVSGAEERAQLNAAIRCLRRGDQLVVTKLDRFARSLEHAIKLERCIAAKGASLVILDPAVDTSTSIGRLMFNMIGAIAQFEREIMLDRQRDGIAAAQAAGKYVGRQPTARRKAGDVMALKAEGVANTEIARRLGIGIASVYRILRGGESAPVLASGRI